jgi:hypothetical protein
MSRRFLSTLLLRGTGVTWPDKYIYTIPPLSPGRDSPSHLSTLSFSPTPTSKRPAYELAGQTSLLLLQCRH